MFLISSVIIDVHCPGTRVGIARQVDVDLLASKLHEEKKKKSRAEGQNQECISEVADEPDEISSSATRCLVS